MRILLLNWRDPKNPKAGGAEIVTLYHAKAWVKAGNDVFWVASKENQLPSQETIDGITIIRRGSSFTVFLHAFLFYVFSGKTFDVVIDEIHGIPFFTPLYVRAPKIAFIHEIAQEIWDYMYPFPISVFGKFLETFFLPLYRKIPVWTDAPSTIEELKKLGFSKNSCVAIACPIENKPLQKLPQKEVQHTYIFVSRVVRMKGIEEVIKAFAFIQKEDALAKLWIVGSGEAGYIKKLKHMTKEYGIFENVIFWGKVSGSQKLSLMSRSHILLHASVKEGWGLVVLEAASQGTPAIVYNVSGLKDTVKDGKTGIVLSQNSPQEMARQVLLLVKDKLRYTNFQKNGFVWVKSLTWEKATKESLDLLKSVTYG